jgi:O-antigen/teichoic acid export membrane protein
MGDYLIYFFSTVASSGIPFLLLMALARFLPVSDTGMISLYTTQISLAAMVVGLGAYSSVQARYFLDSDRFASYLSASVSLHVLGLFIAFCSLVLFGESLSSWTSLPLWALCLAVTVGFMQCILNMQLLLTQARGWVWRYLIIQLMQTVPLAICAPLLAVGLGLGWKGFVFAQIGQLFLITIWTVKVLIEKFGLRLHFDRQDLVANIRFGLTLVPHSIAGFIVVGYDRIYVSSHAGPIATGIYSMMLQIGMLISLVITAVNKVYTPWLYAKLSDSSEWSKIALTTWKGVALVVALCAGFYPLTYFSVGYLLGEKFLPGRDLLPWMILGGMVNGIYLLVTNMIFYSERILLLSLASVAGAFAKWWILPFLFEMYGLQGVAASNVAGLIVTALLVMIFVVHIYDRRVLFGNFLGPVRVG